MRTRPAAPGRGLTERESTKRRPLLRFQPRLPREEGCAESAEYPGRNPGHDNYASYTSCEGPVYLPTSYHTDSCSSQFRFEHSTSRQFGFREKSRSN
jgi:hypothetical protein